MSADTVLLTSNSGFDDRFDLVVIRVCFCGGGRTPRYSPNFVSIQYLESSDGHSNLFILCQNSSDAECKIEFAQQQYLALSGSVAAFHQTGVYASVNGLTIPGFTTSQC